MNKKEVRLLVKKKLDIAIREADYHIIFFGVQVKRVDFFSSQFQVLIRFVRKTKTENRKQWIYKWINPSLNTRYKTCLLDA